MANPAIVSFDPTDDADVASITACIRPIFPSQAEKELGKHTRSPSAFISVENDQHVPVVIRTQVVVRLRRYMHLTALAYIGAADIEGVKLTHIHYICMFKV